MLEAISKDITIVNIQWLPGSQTNIAVATRDFIKIYDLSEDALSPTHNIMLMNGFITDFTFSSEQLVSEGGDLNNAKSILYASSKSGRVYF